MHKKSRGPVYVFHAGPRDLCQESLRSLYQCVPSAAGFTFIVSLFLCRSQFGTLYMHARHIWCASGAHSAFSRLVSSAFPCFCVSAFDLYFCVSAFLRFGIDLYFRIPVFLYYIGCGDYEVFSSRVSVRSIFCPFLTMVNFSLSPTLCEVTIDERVLNDVISVPSTA